MALIMFFNTLVVQGNSNSDFSLANLLTIANAQTENNDGTVKCLEKKTTSKSTTTTYQNNYGEWCDQTETETTVVCEGIGMTSCKAGTTTTYTKEC